MKMFLSIKADDYVTVENEDEYLSISCRSGDGEVQLLIKRAFVKEFIQDVKGLDKK